MNTRGNSVVIFEYIQSALRRVHVLYTHTGASIHYTDTTSGGLHYPTLIHIFFSDFLAVQILL